MSGAQLHPRPHRPAVRGRRYGVTTNHYLATAAGARILDAGGNAVDAGVAAGLCINVLQPDLTSLGGVAPVLVYDRPTRSVASITGVGPWPAGVTADDYARRTGGRIPHGVLRSVVPAAADAWLTALERFGTLTLEEVAGPAIELAAHGFPVYRSLAHNTAKAAERLFSWESSARIFLPGGKVPEAGELLVQADLARTLERLVEADRAARRRGGRAAGVGAARDAFYRGEIARAIADFVTANGGYLTAADLAGFRVDVEAPVQADYRDWTVHVGGPWCQGPALLQALRVLDGFDLPRLGHNTVGYIHLVAQALDLAFADREAFYGDPKFVEVPLDSLLSEEHARALRERIQDGAPVSAGTTGHRGDSTGPARPAEPADADTSYVCVIDDRGSAFSATPSDGFSATPVVPGLGLICSWRGAQSWLEPGHPSVLAGGKRPRLTPSPALVLEDGELRMGLGSPGADIQLQAMLQVLLNMREFGMDPQQAIEAPRFGTMNFPQSFWPHAHEHGLLLVEARVPSQVREGLRSSGRDVRPWPDWSREAGCVCVALTDHTHGTLVVGADPRGEAYGAAW